MVAALRVPGGGAFTRGEIDEYTKFVGIYGARGLAYIKVNERAKGVEGLQSPIVKNIPLDNLNVILDRVGAVDGDIVFFGTTTINPSTPCSPFTANLYAFTFTGGPAYDTNNDGTLTASTTSKSGKTTTTTAGDSTKVFSKSGSRGTSPFIVDQHLVFSAGGELEMFGDPEDFNNGVGQAGVRILSWRMLK